MSVGGTSNVAPIGAPGTPGASRGVGATQPADVAAPSTGRNAAVATGYEPTAGVDAGATSGGGELSTGVARAAYVASNPALAGSRGLDRAAAERTWSDVGAQATAANGATVAAQSAVAAPTAPTAPAGPAAWNEEWDAKFAQVVDSGTMSQLRITGGMGLDAAQLEQALQQTTAESDALVEKLSATHGHEVAKLEQVGTSRSEIAVMAQQVESGQMSEKDLVNAVDAAYGMTGPGIKRMLLGDMLPYGLVPGWGLVSGAIGLGNGVMQGDLSKSTNPFSDRRLFGTKMDAAFTPLMAGGGAVTLYALYQEQQRLKAGRAAIAANPEIAKLAQAKGIDAMPGSALNPFRQKNKLIAGLGRFAEFEKGVQHLESVAKANPKSGAQAQAAVARNVLEAWRSGRIDVAADPVMGVMKALPMGLFNKSRGMLPGIGNRGKQLAEVAMVKHRPTIKLDVRLQGPALTAHMAAAGVQVADGQAKLDLLAKHSDPTLPRGIDSTKRLRDLMMAQSTQDLMQSTKDSAARLQQPTKGRLTAGVLRPGAVDDAFKAVNRVAKQQAGFKGPFGLSTKFSGLPTAGKAAVGAGAAIAALGVGYLGLKGIGKMMGGGAAPAEGEQPAAGAEATAAPGSGQGQRATTGAA